MTMVKLRMKMLTLMKLNLKKKKKIMMMVVVVGSADRKTWVKDCRQGLV